VPQENTSKISSLRICWFILSQHVKFLDKNGVNHGTKKAPLTGGGWEQGKSLCPTRGS